MIDGLFQQLEELEEYKECVRLMDSDSVINSQVNSDVRIGGMIQFMRHWTYISHFLKRMIYHYLENLTLENNIFDRNYSDLESFFYNDYLDMADITPLHHFQPVSVQIPIKLSDDLSIVRLQDRSKIKLWNKLASSDLDKSVESVAYAIEYRFKVRKEGDEQETTLSKNTISIFSTIVTLLRFTGVQSAIYDKVTISILDLPVSPVPPRSFCIIIGCGLLL